VIHDQPLAFEHDADPAIAKAAALARDLTHGNTDGTMVWRAFAPITWGPWAVKSLNGVNQETGEVFFTASFGYA